MKDYGATFLGAVGTTGTLVLNHVNAVLATLCGLVTLLALLLSLRAKKRADDRERVELVRAQAELCDDCRHGREPAHCPLEPDDRPDNCPKRFE